MRYKFLSAKQLESLIPEEYGSHGTLMVMPFIDVERAQNTARQMTNRAGATGLLLCIHDDQKEGFISLVNRAFSISIHQWVGYVAQDAYAGRQWLRIALDVFSSRKTGLLAFNDGKWLGELAAFGLADRRWAEGNYSGHFFHPEYQSHYADVELTLLAQNDNCYAYEPNSVLVEIDPDKDSKPVNNKDRGLFLERQSISFNRKIKNPALLEKFQ